METLFTLVSSRITDTLTLILFLYSLAATFAIYKLVVIRSKEQADTNSKLFSLVEQISAFIENVREIKLK